LACSNANYAISQLLEAHGGWDEGDSALMTQYMRIMPLQKGQANDVGHLHRPEHQITRHDIDSRATEDESEGIGELEQASQSRDNMHSSALGFFEDIYFPFGALIEFEE
jgi:hypothetical protein